MLLIVLVYPKRAVVISAEGYDDHFLAADSFELHWNHSIEKEEWYEIYEIDGRNLILTKTYFKTFGAGVPHLSEEKPEFTEDGFVGFTINDEYPEIYMNVSENVKTRVVQNDEIHRLYEIFDTNTSVEIKVVNRPLYDRLIGG